MKIKVFLCLCLVVLVGCNGGGDGSDNGSVENKTFSMPTEKSASDYFENNDISYNVTYHNLSTGEQTSSGSGKIWGKEYSEQIDGIERNVSELLIDLVINGTSQTNYQKTYIVMDGASWYKYDYETKTIIEERLYSSPEALYGILDFLPATATDGDFGDLPDYQMIDDSYSSDVVKRTENSWKFTKNGENANVITITSSYNRYDEKILYDEYVVTINEFGEILKLELIKLDYSDNLKMIMTMTR